MDRDLDSLSEAQFLVTINKVDKELEDFMKAAKKDCHKYIGGHIKWCPETGVWMKNCWLLGATNARRPGREQRGNLRGGCVSKLCVD
jgi:hypothetical protein